MADETFSYSGEHYCVGPAARIKGMTKEAAAEISRIRNLYNAGNPFFTKGAIRYVCRQFKQNPAENPKISVRGIDEVEVDFDRHTGMIVEPFDPESEPDVEYLVQTPFISYRSTPALIVYSDYDDFYMVYCNLRISHWMVPRNKFSKEPLGGAFPTQPRTKARGFFQARMRSWETTESCKRLRSVLASKSVPCTISKIVGFACGPVSSNPEDPLTCRSSFQHALMLTMREVLGKEKGNSEMICYAQDPAYTDVDKCILMETGITVLDDPEAFLVVDESTVVFSCSPNVPVRQIISDITQPAIMIWDRVQNGPDSQDQEEGIVWTDPDSPRLREMIHQFYDEFEFPDDTDNFGDLVIYVRRAATHQYPDITNPSQ